MPETLPLAELYASVTRTAPEFLATLERWFHCKHLVLFSGHRDSQSCWLLASNDLHFGTHVPAPSSWPEGHFCHLEEHQLYLSVRPQKDNFRGLLVEFASQAQAEKTYHTLTQPYASQRRLLDRIVEATSLFLRLHEGALARQALLALLDPYPCPITVFNASREVVYVNQAGRSLPKTLKGIELTPQGLRLTSEQDNARLQRHIKNLVTRQLLNVEQPDTVLTLHFSGQAIPILLTTHQPLQWRSGLSTSEFLVWLYWMPPQLTPALPLGRLKASFNLSPTESELATFLFHSGTLKHYAQQRGVSEYTARKQLQTILQKTGARTQEDLMITLFQQLIFR